MLAKNERMSNVTNVTARKAKESQGYDPKPVLPTCGNCANFASDHVKSQWCDFVEERNMRCGIGHFAVKKMGTCNIHVFKAELEKTEQ